MQRSEAIYVLCKSLLPKLRTRAICKKVRPGTVLVFVWKCFGLVLLERERSKFTLHCPHVPSDFVFTNLNRTAWTLNSCLADLGSGPVNIFAPTLFCSLVPCKIPRHYGTSAVPTSYPSQVQLGELLCNFVRHSSNWWDFLPFPLTFHFRSPLGL